MLMAPTNRYTNRSSLHSQNNGDAKPYCRCWHKRMKAAVPREWHSHNECPVNCSCGEEDDIKEWKWQKPPDTESSWVVLSDNNELVTFHPIYSSGTAAVRGDTPMELNCHYYWEVKMLTDTYGTDIMVGLGTEKFDLNESRHKFSSLLGHDAESYGISYTGKVQHDARTSRDSWGFCKGSIVGLRLDQWQGTLEFYINRQSQGVSFYNLRRHPTLFPIVCSTAAQSSMKLVYAASWRASLLVDALKILAASVKDGAKDRLPPGLWCRLKTQFWLTMPSKSCLNEEDILAEELRRDSKTSMLGDLPPFVHGLLCGQCATKLPLGIVAGVISMTTKT